MSEIVRKKVCKCENCGNEAEMIVTCSLPDDGAEDGAVSVFDESSQRTESEERVKGTATCTHCGNEADMWIDR